jgi:hypothetical protein
VKAVQTGAKPSNSPGANLSAFGLRRLQLSGVGGGIRLAPNDLQTSQGKSLQEKRFTFRHSSCEIRRR